MASECFWTANWVCLAPKIIHDQMVKKTSVHIFDPKGSSPDFFASTGFLAVSQQRNWKNMNHGIAPVALVVEISERWSQFDLALQSKRIKTVYSKYNWCANHHVTRIYFHSVCSHLSPHLTLVCPIELNYPSLFGEPNHWPSCNIIQSHSHCRTEHTVIYHRQPQRLCNDSSDGHCPMYNGVCQGKHWNQWNPWANRGSYKSTQTVQNIFCRWTKFKPLLIKKFSWVHFRIQDIPKESGYLAPA